MSAKALDYAEQQLGVHEVYEQARKARNDLDECLTRLSEARDKKRDLEFRLSDREMEIAADERGRHPDMSQAAMDKHLKQAFAQDDSWRELREQLSKVIGDAEGYEYDKAIHETDIRIAVARLQELGGYFNYLAAVKQADEANKTKKTEKPT